MRMHAVREAFVKERLYSIAATIGVYAVAAVTELAYDLVLLITTKDAASCDGWLPRWKGWSAVLYFLTVVVFLFMPLWAIVLLFRVRAAPPPLQPALGPVPHTCHLTPSRPTPPHPRCFTPRPRPPPTARPPLTPPPC